MSQAHCMAREQLKSRPSGGSPRCKHKGHTHTHTHTHKHTHTHTRTHTCARTRAHIRTRTCTRTRARTRTHTCTHAHSHAHTLSLSFSLSSFCKGTFGHIKGTFGHIFSSATSSWSLFIYIGLFNLYADILCRFHFNFPFLKHYEYLPIHY